MLLDTSGLLCCLNRSESRHESATSLFKSTPRKITHNYILAEFVPLAQVRGFSRGMALEYLAYLSKAKSVEVFWVDPQTHESALNLLRKQLDKSYSLCDAVSFLLMREQGIYDALTTDRHFEQAGFRRLLPDDRL